MGIQPFRVHVDDPDAVQLVASYLGGLMYPWLGMGRQPVVLCIGCNNSCGDSLGPFVGTWLREYEVPLPIYGTLDDPVGAKDLQDVVERIRRRHPNAATVAVDACLGRAESVGCVTLQSGPLEPGRGVGLDLGRVGDVGIKGVVNIGGFMEWFVLQYTRLGLIWSMSRVIAQGVARWAATLPTATPVASGEVGS